MVFFFPHRNEELGNYCSIVMDLFRAASSNPSVAISFDVHVHDKYSKKPFHLDDWNQLNFPLLTQMLSSTPLATPRAPKRGASTQSTSSGSNPKHTDIPCHNWSWGICKAEVCLNCCKHGVCFICGEGHRAKDNEQCFTALQHRD